MNQFDRKESLAAMLIRRQAKELAASYCRPCDIEAGVKAILARALESESTYENQRIVDDLEYPNPE